MPRNDCNSNSVTANSVMACTLTGSGLTPVLLYMFPKNGTSSLLIWHLL